MADQPVGSAERLHWSALLSQLARSVRGMWGLFAGGAYFAVQGQWWLIIVMASLFFIFATGAAVVRWSRFSYRLADDQIRIDSGVVSRTHRSIPFDRVQDVDISQGPVARLLGVARVRFETGGGSAGAEDGVLDAVTLDRAEMLRDLIRARRLGVSPASEVQDAPEDARPIYAMDLRRLVFAGLFNFSLALFAGLLGLTQSIGDVIGFDPFNRGFWLKLLSTGTPVADFLLAHRIIAIGAGLIVLGLVGLLTGVARTTLRDFGFRVDRTDAGLRRRRGLLTRTDVTLPLARVQAAVVATGPIRDHFGWSQLSFQNLAGDEGGKGNHSLAPLATDEELDRIVAELGWEPLSASGNWRSVSAAYLWVRLFWLAPLLLVAAFQALFVPWVGAVAGLLILCAGVSRYLSWRRTRYALDADRLRVRTGWWRRRAIALPLSRIQSVDLSADPISRLFGTADLRFGVAGGGLFPRHEVPSLRRETARQLRDELLTAVA